MTNLFSCRMYRKIGNQSCVFNYCNFNLTIACIWFRTLFSSCLEAGYQLKWWYHSILIVYTSIAESMRRVTRQVFQHYVNLFFWQVVAHRTVKLRPLHFKMSIAPWQNKSWLFKKVLKSKLQLRSEISSLLQCVCKKDVFQ